MNYDRDEFIYAPFLQENRDGTLKWRQQFDKIYYVFSKKEFSFFYNDDNPLKLIVDKENFDKSLQSWKQNEKFQVIEKSILVRE